MEIDVMRAGAVQTWIGAVGMYAYLTFILRRRRRSSLEHRMILVLLCLGGMFLMRGFEWLTGNPWLRVLTFAHATLVPLAATLLAEGLLRRHVPPPLKMFVAVGTAVFFTWNLFTHGATSNSPPGFSVFVVVVLAWLFVILVTRDRPQLSPGENQLVDSLAVAFGIGVLVAFTDFGYRPPLLPVGIGAVGGLIFVYACVRLSRASDTGWRVFREVVKWVVEALVLAAGAAFVLRGAPFPVHVSNAAAIVAAVLLFAVLFRLHELRGYGRARAFLDGLLAADTRSLEGFLGDLGRMPLAERHVVLRGRDLESYDVARLTAAFGEEPRAWSMSQLRSGLQLGVVDREAGEQLVDALASRGMTHATLLHLRPPVLLLVNLPQLAGEQDPREELGLLGKLGRLIPADPEAAEIPGLEDPLRTTSARRA